METILVQKKWIKFYECNCGGTPRCHYHNPEKKGYEIVIRPLKNTFRILLNNQIIGGPFWGYQLEIKMLELIS